MPLKNWLVILLKLTIVQLTMDFSLFTSCGRNLIVLPKTIQNKIIVTLVMKTILHWFYGMSVFDYTTRLECANYGGFSYLPQITKKNKYYLGCCPFFKSSFLWKFFIESIFPLLGKREHQNYVSCQTYRKYLHIS